MIMKYFKIYEFIGTIFVVVVVVVVVLLLLLLIIFCKKKVVLIGLLNLVNVWGFLISDSTKP